MIYIFKESLQLPRGEWMTGCKTGDRETTWDASVVGQVRANGGLSWSDSSGDGDNSLDVGLVWLPLIGRHCPCSQQPHHESSYWCFRKCSLTTCQLRAGCGSRQGLYSSTLIYDLGIRYCKFILSFVSEKDLLWVAGGSI